MTKGGVAAGKIESCLQEFESCVKNGSKKGRECGNRLQRI
jgi:hypothetical protein